MNPITFQDLSNFYQNLINSQNNLTNNLVLILIAVSAVFVGAQFIWNYFQIKRYISNEIEKKTKEISEAIKKDADEKLKTKLLELEKEIKLNQDLRKETIKLSADVYRSYALLTYERGLIYTSFVWWLRALQKYKELNQKASVAAMISALDKFTPYEQWVNNMAEIPRKKELDKIKRIIENSIPDYFPLQKEQFRNIINLIYLKFSITPTP